MSETFKRGDRVIVRDVVDGTPRDYVGRVGTLRIVSTDGRYVVLMDGPGDVRIVATAVESLIETLASAQAAVAATTGVKVGDRVRIVQTIDNSSRSRAVVGMVGRLEDIYPAFTSGKVYTVWLGGQLYAATKVEPAPADTPSPSEPVLDPRRVAAAREAVSILWDGAEEVDVELLAEWLLNEPKLEAKPDPTPSSFIEITNASAVYTDETHVWTRDAATRAAGLGPVAATIDETSHWVKAAEPASADEIKVGPAWELEKARALTDSVLTLGDLEVDFDDCDDDDVVAIAADRCEYLKEDQVDELIAYLQAAKRVHQSQQAERDI